MLRIALLALFIFFPNSSHAKDFAPEHTIVLKNRWSMGHACNVNGYTLTSAHLVDPREAGTTDPLPSMSFRYEIPGVRGGRARSVAVVDNGDIDVAVMQLSGPPPEYGELGPAPKEGDRIRWVEYDWRKNEDYMAPRGREAKVSRIRAGTIILDAAVTPGGSGGCAYNDAGQIVGLITWYSEGEDDEEGVGGVLGIFGGWWGTLKLEELGR